MVAALFLANAFYFLVKGYFFQQAGFGYVWSMFNYFVAGISLLFMIAFKKMAFHLKENLEKKRKR